MLEACAVANQNRLVASEALYSLLSPGLQMRRMTFAKAKGRWTIYDISYEGYDRGQKCDRGTEESGNREFGGLERRWGAVQRGQDAQSSLRGRMTGSRNHGTGLPLSSGMAAVAEESFCARTRQTW
jgi:hypothetical protein